MDPTSLPELFKPFRAQNVKEKTEKMKFQHFEKIEKIEKITTIRGGSGGEIYTVFDEESESEVENHEILHPDLEN